MNLFEYLFRRRQISSCLTRLKAKEMNIIIGISAVILSECFINDSIFQITFSVVRHSLTTTNTREGNVTMFSFVLFAAVGECIS